MSITVGDDTHDYKGYLGYLNPNTSPDAFNKFFLVSWFSVAHLTIGVNRENINFWIDSSS